MVNRTQGSLYVCESAPLKSTFRVKDSSPRKETGAGAAPTERRGLEKDFDGTRRVIISLDPC